MNAAEPYRDRKHAGRVLAGHVQKEFGDVDAVVLALPRGGVPVGFEVARALPAPLDVFVVRKLGVPAHPELAMGAIAANGFEVLNEGLIADLGITRPQIAAVIKRETEELERREALYRADRPRVALHNRTVILVDDGLATGFSMRAAVGALRRSGTARLVVAVPVGAVESCEEIACEVDGFICPLRPEPFHAVGLWYRDFAATTDDEVRECLAAAAANFQEDVPRRGEGDEGSGLSPPSPLRGTPSDLSI